MSSMSGGYPEPAHRNGRLFGQDPMHELVAVRPGDPGLPLQGGDERT